MHYMISVWWLNLLDGLGQYVTLPVDIEQVVVMTNNIITLG